MDREMIVDIFAGGGGASLGIRMALGRGPDVVIDRDSAAVEMHRANHPETRHLCADVRDVVPHTVTEGRTVGLAWFSPPCTEFSPAKGGRPVRAEVQDLAWEVVRWAMDVRPRLVIVENVPGFRRWGPSGADGRPDVSQSGETYARWCDRLRASGYVVEGCELRACDYGAPTIRRRWFVVARRDGRPILWPRPTHGEPGNLFGLPPYRVAAECIDWSRPCPSIFGRRRRFAKKTMCRIASGVRRHILESRDPFMRRLAPGGGVHVSIPGGSSVVGPGRQDLDLVSEFLSRYFRVAAGKCPRSSGSLPSADTSECGVRGGQGCLATHAISNLVVFLGTARARCMREPFPTILARGSHHIGELRTYIRECGDTVTGEARLGWVDMHGMRYAIEDIGLRVLTPRELARAQGFPDDYVLTGGKTSQVARIGNSVCPPLAEALVAANM